MRRTHHRIWPLVALGAAALLLGGAQATQNTQGTQPAPAPKRPTIEGSYRLVSRDLPDGTRQKYPEIVGLLTFTGKYRNFNVAWQNASGKHFSLSLISEYKLTDKEYTEKNLYRCVNDEISGAGLQYDMSGKSGTAPLKRDGNKLEIALPLFNEPAVVFDGNNLTATRAGEFTDHWQRVE